MALGVGAGGESVQDRNYSASLMITNTSLEELYGSGIPFTSFKIGVLFKKKYYLQCSHQHHVVFLNYLCVFYVGINC